MTPFGESGVDDCLEVADEGRTRLVVDDDPDVDVGLRVSVDAPFGGVPRLAHGGDLQHRQGPDVVHAADEVARIAECEGHKLGPVSQRHFERVCVQIR